jgi:DNA-binding MarR family transcriptional regulator
LVPKQHYKASTYSSHCSVGYLTKRAHSLLLDAVEPLLEKHGLTYAQYIILAMLRDSTAVNPKDICLQFRHDSGALTRVIDQLAERGFVVRLRSDVDRRKVELQLTAVGRKVLDAMVPSVLELLNLALEDFSGAEVQELTRLLTKLNTRLQTMVESHKGMDTTKLIEGAATSR